MTAQTLLNLRNNLRTGMGDLADTISARTCVSVKEYGAVGTDSSSNATDDTAAFLAATSAVSAAGGGAIYVPAGTYWINANEWTLPPRVKVFGDGYQSVIKKATNGRLLDISGNTWFGNTSPAQVRNSYCILRDLFFHGEDHTGELVRTYYASELLVDKCRFGFNSGPAFDAVELWDSRFQNCFFDWCGSTTQPAFQMRNSTSDSTGTFGHSPDNTNAVYFYGCRWESFKNGAVWMERTFGTQSLSQIYFTNCKLETHYLAGPMIKFSSANDQSNCHIDTLFISVNSFNSGYTTATDLIEWNVNNGCSLRNIWVYQAAPAVSGQYMVRTVVRADCSFNSNVIENVFVSGTAPSLGVIEAQGSTDPMILGFVGGTSNSVGANSVVEHAGGFRALTAARTAILSDDKTTYTNATSGNLVVTLPANAPAGWSCKAMQLSSGGTITFVGDTGVTFLCENGTNHRRTAGINQMMDLVVASNSDIPTAAVYHVRGKTVVAP